MPERSRIAGEWIAPAQSSTSRARSSVPAPGPADCTRNPTARPPRTARGPPARRRGSPGSGGPGRLEIRLVGGDAATVAQVDRVAGHALALRRIQVRVPRIAGGKRGGAEGAVDLAPGGLRRAIHRQRPRPGTGPASSSMASNSGSTSRGGPALASELGPLVERRGHAADGDLRVDGRTAAQRPAAPVEAGSCAARAARHQPRPLPRGLVRRVVHERDDVGAEHRRRRLRRAPVPPGLEQQHPAGGIRRELRGGGGTGGAAADHDDVVHVLSPR